MVVRFVLFCIVFMVCISNISSTNKRDNDNDDNNDDERKKERKKGSKCPSFSVRCSCVLSPICVYLCMCIWLECCLWFVIALSRCFVAFLCVLDLPYVLLVFSDSLFSMSSSPYIARSRCCW
uniref:Secreted protein n=1 Tax=Anopheles darlingi TaxID=43151 RepID=A0A2M4D7R1_ANODA